MNSCLNRRRRDGDTMRWFARKRWRELGGNGEQTLAKTEGRAKEEK